MTNNVTPIRKDGNTPMDNDTPPRPDSQAQFYTEMLTALKSIQNGQGVTNLNKAVQGIVIAAIIGIGAWLLNGMNTVQSTLIRVDTTVLAMSKAVDTASTRIDTMQTRQTEIQVDVLDLKRRMDTVEGGTSQRPQGR